MNNLARASDRSSRRYRGYELASYAAGKAGIRKPGYSWHRGCRKIWYNVPLPGTLDGGFGAEVLATMVERIGVKHLKSARRIGAPRIPVPFSPTLESHVILNADRIGKALREMVQEL